MNDDDNQILIPDSFLALYSRPGSLKLTEPAARVRERYELCEDLAQMLMEPAGSKLHERGMSEADVLGQMQAGLAVEGSPVQPPEAEWVVRRLAELLGWEALPPGQPDQ